MLIYISEQCFLASKQILSYYAPMKSWLYLLILCVSLPAFVIFPQLIAASDSPNRQDSINFLEQAVSKTNIFELPSFVMKANVKIDNHGKLLTGTYELLWNGPDQWREGISLPGYSEVQIGGKGKIWLQRSSGVIPLAIYNLHQALGFGSSAGSPALMSLTQLAIAPSDTVKKIQKHKEHGDALTCYEIENDEKNVHEKCVHDDSGTIARVSPYEDADLGPAGVKVFPRHLSIHPKNESTAEVSITELSTPAQFPAEIFAPPAGVSAQAGCINPALPHLAKRQEPQYSPIIRQERPEGIVALDVLIGTDGVPRIKKVVESAAADLESVSQQTISQWRFDPGLCAGHPVEVETILLIRYVHSP